MDLFLNNFTDGRWTAIHVQVSRFFLQKRLPVRGGQFKPIDEYPGRTSIISIKDIRVSCVTFA